MATISVRIDEKLKKDTEEVLEDIGLTMSGAISVYFSQIVQKKAIPFKLESKKVIDPDNYYNDEWYKGPEAAELLRRIKSENYVVHDLSELERYERSL